MKSGSKDKKIVIIGAGPCGLGAAWRLHELGYDSYEIYEKESYVGGLAASFKDKNGFTWDVGGHVLHSHYDYFDRMFESVLRDEYLTHQRESWVYLLERFVPYPFQNNIHRLPKAIRDECLEGLRNAASAEVSDPKNFSEWITASFGAGVSKYFMYPYNYKVWAYPPELMNYQWVGDRVSKVDLKRIEQTIVTGQDDVSWGPNYVFKFPRRGGTGAIWNGVAKTFDRHIHRNKRLVRVDTTQSRLYFDDGSDDSYDLLLSTLPLDVLVTLVGQKNTAAHKLHHSSVTIVGLGFAGAVPETFRTKCWIYFPDDITPFFRATVFSNYSPNNAPAGHWSLMT